MNLYCFWRVGNSWQRILLIALIGLLSACAKEPPIPYYHQSGGLAQVVRCPLGEYELCLQQISEACLEAGYTVHEKVRQVKFGIWSDTAEMLIVAQCNANPR